MWQDLAPLRFGIPEILSVIGLAQCVYILVYIAFRAGSWRMVAIPFLYFSILAAAFFCGFARAVFADHLQGFHAVEWALWTAGPPVSVLLMAQIARLAQPPPARHYWMLGLMPAAFVVAVFSTRMVNGCNALTAACSGFHDWLALSGLLAGVASLAAMTTQRALLIHLTAQPVGRERYWLILALVLVNLGLLATMLLSLTPLGDAAATIRTICGLGFVYLAGTSLFRIYPQAIRLAEKPVRGLSDEEHKIAEKIEALLTREKVYQEPSYNRVSLAQELGISETAVSRIVNQHFGKTVPQLFNELKVADAKRLLDETNAPIKTVVEEVGFNSIASFNRVFKEITGISPGHYRERTKAKANK